MSLRRDRALARLRKLRASLDREGLPPQPRLAHVAALTHALIERLGERTNPLRASAAADYVYRIATPSFRATGIESRLDCRRGCDFCCRGYVSATAPQIFAAARAVRAQPRAHEATVARVALAASAVRGVDWQARLRMHHPCPMLVEGACGIYAARPLACRGFVSFSAAACRQAFESHADSVRVPPVYANVRSALESALRAALKRHGHAYVSYELDTALERVLGREDAERAWLEGEDVFSGVDVDRSADPAEAAQREFMLDTLIAAAQGEIPQTAAGPPPGG